MKRLFLLLCVATTLAATVPASLAQTPAAPATQSASAAPGPATNAASGADTNTQAAAAIAARQQRAAPRSPDFLEHLVDSILGLFDVRTNENTITHYVISLALLVVALLARRIITGIVFVFLRKLASKTETTLDDKLFPAMEAPAATFVMMVGIFAALKVLKLSPETDGYISAGSRVAFSLVIFWGMWRALSAILEHGGEIAREKQLGIAAFMPWIRKTLMTVFVVVGVLLTIQSLGYDVRAILAGLGIGGLAFALAAQDTLANVFGAIVVAIDQPFKIGEAVKIGANVGGVEDIGLRSTRIRLVDKSLMIIPNKTVASETITNYSRFIRRRVEQVIGLTYDTQPAQMEAMVDEIRGILTSEPLIDKASVMVFFRDFSASSMDIWVVYETPDPDFKKHMAVKQRMNLAIMRAVEARGLSFAFPTQTINLAPGTIEQLAATKH
jgi:MscS family membrane protein